MVVNVSELAGAIAGISLAAFGTVLVLPRRLFTSIERDLANYPTQPSAASDRLTGISSYRALSKYTATGLTQSWISFVASMVFAALGFLVILSGVAIATFKHGSITTAAVSGLSGTVVETVAGLFFTVNRLNQKNMIGFYDKLRSDQRVEYAINMAKNLPDAHFASKLQALLALQFIEADNIPELFQQLLEKAESANGAASAVPGLVPKPRDRQPDLDN